MRDALHAARVVPGFASAARVHLVEASAALTELQNATLADFPGSLTRSGELDAFTPPAIIFANEFLELLARRPVDQDSRGMAHQGRRARRATATCNSGPSTAIVRETHSKRFFRMLRPAPSSKRNGSTSSPRHFRTWRGEARLRC